MVQNRTSINNLNSSIMSISSSVCLIDSPMITVKSDVIATHEIPLTALSRKTQRKLSHLLNSKKILRSEEGYERDWRGLASLAQQKFLCEENAVNGDDPMTKVIKLWCTNNPKTATFTYLKQFLGTIDRWDVSDDIYENLVEDTKSYQTKLQPCSKSSCDDNVNMSSAHLYGNFGHGSDSNILTPSDVIRAQKGLPPQLYDAFVLYADADLNYASEMLTKLEDNPEYNFKLCIKDRDLLAGVQFEHVALTKLVEERCKHLIVILTHEFLKSPENKFLVNYTQALQIQHKTRKIVPLLYDETVDIPRTLKIYTHLRYNPSTASLFNFWSKLANSIENVNVAADMATSFCGNASNSTLTTCLRPSNSSICQVNLLPTTDIAKISIIPPDNSEKTKKKEISKFKPSTIRIPNNKAAPNNDIVLSNPHSTSKLHTIYKTKNAISMSDLSTTSICSETKEKKKWSSKILRKVFNRSSSKLQEV